MWNSVPIYSYQTRWLWSTALILCLSISWSQVARGQSKQDLLFFTSIDAFKNTSGAIPGVEDSFVRPTVDVLYTYSGNKFRFLGEYLWSSEESELERLKAGWQLTENNMLWLGRFHSTAKYWTSEYHHGQFLQTSITRPSVDEWEDESGPMPSHITGTSLELQSQFANESAINYTFSAGLAPKFIDEELVPFDLLDWESGHKLGLNFGMLFRPSVVSANQFGLAMAWNEIDVVSDSNPDLADLNDIGQLTVSLSADWYKGPLRLIANIVYFNNDMRYVSGPVKDEFALAYFQVEYEVNEHWTVFGRVDTGLNEDASPYLRMLPAFIAHRNMLGWRWDFADFQSLTMEVADTSSQGDGSSHVTYKEVRFQWSAVFP